MSDDGTLAGIGLSGELQLGSLDLMVGIGTSLKNLATEEKRRNDAAESRLRNIPVDTPRVASGVYPAAGNLEMDLGQPARFRWWEVKRLVVGGALFSDTPAGAAFIFAKPIESGPLTILQLRDFTTATFPQISFYGRREQIIRDEESLHVVITGGTPGTLYTAVATVDDYPGGVLLGNVP